MYQSHFFEAVTIVFRQSLAQRVATCKYFKVDNLCIVHGASYIRMFG